MDVLFGEQTALVDGDKTEYNGCEIDRILSVADKISDRYYQKISAALRASGRDDDPLRYEQHHTVREILSLVGDIPAGDFMRVTQYGFGGVYTSGAIQINEGDTNSPLYFRTEVKSQAKTEIFLRGILSYIDNPNYPGNNGEKIIVSAGDGPGDFSRNARSCIYEMGRKDIDVLSLDLSKALLDRQVRLPGMEGDSIEFFLGSDEECMVRIEVGKKEDTKVSILSLEEARKLLKNNPALKDINSEALSRFLIRNPHTERAVKARILSEVEKSIGSRVIASADVMPFADKSVDAVFANELLDMMPPVVYYRDLGRTYKVFVELDSRNGNKTFKWSMREITDSEEDRDDQELANFKLNYFREVYGMEPRGLFTVNVAHIRFMQESARVLKRGGILNCSDYVDEQAGIFGDKLITNLKDLLDLSSNGAYEHQDVYRNFISYIRHIDEGRDITCMFEPDFIVWLGKRFGLNMIVKERTQNYLDGMAGSLGINHKGINQLAGVHKSFYTVVFQKA